MRFIGRFSFLFFLSLIFMSPAKATEDPNWLFHFEEARLAYMAENPKAAIDLLETALEELNTFPPDERFPSEVLGETRARIRVMLNGLYIWEREPLKGIPYLNSAARDYMEKGEGGTLAYQIFSNLCLHYLDDESQKKLVRDLCPRPISTIHKFERTSVYNNLWKGSLFNSSILIQEATSVRFPMGEKLLVLGGITDQIDPYGDDTIIHGSLYRPGGYDLIRNPSNAETYEIFFKSRFNFQVSLNSLMGLNIGIEEFIQYFQGKNPEAKLIRKTSFIEPRGFISPVQKGHYYKFSNVDKNDNPTFEEFLIAQKGDETFILKLTTYPEELEEFNKAFAEYMDLVNLDLNNHFDSLFKVRETGLPFCQEGQTAKANKCIKPDFDWF